jgi:hypothetical protein
MFFCKPMGQWDTIMESVCYFLLLCGTMGQDAGECVYLLLVYGTMGHGTGE